MQRPRKAKKIIKKNEKAGLTLPDSKTNSKVKSKEECCWC